MHQTETVLPPPLPPVRNGTYPSSGIMTTTAAEDPIKLWLKIGALDKLEQAVLDGYGHQLIGKTSRIPKINKFLQNVPGFQTKIDQIHESVVKGEEEKLIELIEHEKLAMCRDHNGASPLHKAIIHKQIELVHYLLKNHGSVLHARDHEGRSPLHYAALLKDSGEIYELLLEAGADKMAVDNVSTKPFYGLYYLLGIFINLLPRSRWEALHLLLILNSNLGIAQGRIASAYRRQSDMNVDRLLEDQPKRPKPPRRLVMRAQVLNGRKSRERSARPIITKAGLRHFIRAGDIEKLEQVILHGYGNKLLDEDASDSNMSDFLQTVPTFLERINRLHRAVVRGKIEDMIELMENSEDAEKLALARDQLGATPIHKAIMHGHTVIAKYLAERYPQCLAVRDRILCDIEDISPGAKGRYLAEPGNAG
ncbi:Acyl-CoA-binding domain-containing protein 2 [Nymphon striatum]|nr:Acyl-CoA-binding domain-containing protein 2 [Nymphon striatum]